MRSLLRYIIAGVVMLTATTPVQASDWWLYTAGSNSADFYDKDSLVQETPSIKRLWVASFSDRGGEAPFATYFHAHLNCNSRLMSVSRVVTYNQNMAVISNTPLPHDYQPTIPDTNADILMTFVCGFQTTLVPPIQLNPALTPAEVARMIFSGELGGP